MHCGTQFLHEPIAHPHNSHNFISIIQEIIMHFDVFLSTTCRGFAIILRGICLWRLLRSIFAFGTVFVTFNGGLFPKLIRAIGSGQEKKSLL